MPGMTDDELRALVDSEISNALGYVGKLSGQRRKAMTYYYGEAKDDLAPPEVDGRSGAVSTDLSDVVEWIMPSLVKIFLSTDDAVQFTPQRDGEQESADQATAYCNYVLQRQNPGFVLLHTWFKDALLQKSGVLHTYWDTREDVAEEKYEGLQLDEVVILLQQPDVKLAGQNAYPDPDRKPPQPPPGAMQGPGMMQPPQGMPPQGMAPPQMMPAPQPPMLYDVVIARTKKSQQIRIEPVPPEEFIISRRARNMEDPGIIGRRWRLIASDLIAMGYTQKQVDACTSDDNPSMFSQEWIERISFDDEYPGRRDEQGSDPSRREIWLTDTYQKVDYDGDGIAELRRVLKCGTEILENDAVDEHPFSLITPILMSHRVIGMSMADVVSELMRIKTALLRQYLDGLYLSTNPRMYVDIDKKVNLDDLLTVRPGGIVRGKGPEGVTPLVVPPVSLGALEGLQMLDDMLESRTGVSKQNQFTDSNSLQGKNRTATEVDAMERSSNQRIELIARVFAETGVKSLFLQILKLGKQHAQQATMVRLDGKFVAVDPRQWKTQFDITVNVGLGTGNKDILMQRLMMILQAQEKAAMVGLATPNTIHAALIELTKAAGFRDTSKFFVDPSKPRNLQAPGESMPPPPPDPKLQVEQQKAQFAQQLAMSKQQGDAQLEHVKGQSAQQLEMARLQMHQATEAAQAQADIAVEQHKATMQGQIEQIKATTQAQIAEIKAHYEMQLEAIKHQTSEATQIKITEIKAAADIEVARVKAMISNGAAVLQAELTAAGQALTPAADTSTGDDASTPIGQVMARLEATMQGLTQAHMAPKMIIRDQNGVAQGIGPAGG